MPILTTIEVHSTGTDNHGYRYQFTPKHHGADARAAQWLPSLSLDEEFGVFNSADRHELLDDRGWLYGVDRSAAGLRDLGTWAQQIAEFPSASTGQPWHGYPIWTISEMAPQNRRGEKMRPDKNVFLKMERTGLISPRERKRLFKGVHI